MSSEADLRNEIEKSGQWAEFQSFLKGGYDVEKEMAEAHAIAARIHSKAQNLVEENRRLRERLDYLETPEGLSNAEDFKAMKLENEVLRKRHRVMKNEKGAQKHKEDMLEQRVMRLEMENSKMKNALLEFHQRGFIELRK